MTDKQKLTARKRIAATLAKVYGLLKDKSKWTKGYYQRYIYDEDEENVIGSSYCLVGACRKVNGLYEDEAQLALAANILGTKREVLESISYGTWYVGGTEDEIIIQFNDAGKRTHAQVLGLLKRTETAVLAGKLDYALFF